MPSNAPQRIRPTWPLGVTAALIAALIGTTGAFCLFGGKTAPESTKSPPPSTSENAYTGSSDCRRCHEKFYQLWADSHHGLAMQPFTARFAKEHLTTSPDDIRIGQADYRVELTADGGRIVERGKDGLKKYPMVHVLGGKNVYYFLTPLDHGRLQVLPLGYRVHEKKWFDVPASGVRHFVDRTDAPLDWRHSAYTFNTSCYNCHVSQLSQNYNPTTRTYHTVWAEPGINCETCHGPGAEHIRVCQAAPAGHPPADLKIIRTKQLTIEQNNDTCAPCHAKMMPLTVSFTPGDRFFDHFDLVALEDQDFYPDGRDLGENYTYTSWRMSPCVRSGQLGCTHCHTSSGRYRFRDNPNAACLPCHEDRVAHATAHTFHQADSPGNRCTGCHMPTTGFAAMQRTDHSMRPPTPAATVAFHSPNACNLCHTDHDAAWADTLVRQWRKRDYQSVVLRRAGLIDAARRGDWARLPEMLDELTRTGRNEIVAVSLARLLRNCDDPRKRPALLKAAHDLSPLVRGAVAEALGTIPSPESAAALAAACSDDSRLVRVRAAAALADFPPEAIPDADRQAFQNALQEYLASLRVQPDHWTSHYNLGNFFLAQGDPTQAAAAFESAMQLEPQALPPYLNASVAYARLGRNAEAETALKKAVSVAPDNPAVHINLGMLLAEAGRLPEAESALRAALKLDPRSAVAAYNLSVLLGAKHPDEALRWAKTAYQITPNSKYGYNLAFFLQQHGDLAAAVAQLREVLRRDPHCLDASLLLAKLLEDQGQPAEALQIYQSLLRDANPPPQIQRHIEENIRRLEQRAKNKYAE
jgi:tetratricopeptide (TPR) repeat protein